MCGIIGIHSSIETNQIVYEVFECLMSLQHRGQDSVGIANERRVIKRPGLVKYAFEADDLSAMQTLSCIGHVRYATNGVVDHIQPLYTSLPRRITLCHNGNILNTKDIRRLLIQHFNCVCNSKSDSDLIMALFSCQLYQRTKSVLLDTNIIQETIEYLHEKLVGSYSLLILIEDFGMIAVRDPQGVRPLVWGQKLVSSKGVEQVRNMIVSETVATDLAQYIVQRDVLPGETIIFQHYSAPRHYRTRNCSLRPCLFEYIYFARPDSYLDNVSVHEARLQIGRAMADLMIKKWINHDNIDVIVPVPDTSITFAHGIQDVLKKPVREGFVKNRYIDRTFIMQNEHCIQKNIKRKLCGIRNVFQEKNVLIVDDSIVRGNTSRHIIAMAREYGANQVFFASCAPIVKDTNQYGIYIPTREELISFQRTEEEIRAHLGADYLLFHDLNTITNIIRKLNPLIQGFETSMFGIKN